MEPNTILNYLSIVSNKNLPINLMMHLVVILTTLTMVFLKNTKVKQYIFNGAILTLFLSVTINAAIYGNPFHAITFVIMTIISVVVLIRGKNKIDIPKKGIATIMAIIFVVIGLWYPEFVEVNPFASLLLSPVGIVPCPTLLTALGMLNLFYSKANNLQFAVTVFFAAIYGIIGTFILEVYLDISLIGLVLFSIYNKVIREKQLVKEEVNLRN